MKLDALLSRARYLAIALPLFALGSTIHAGCTSNPNFYYGNGGGVYHTTSASNEPSSCVVYRTGESGTGGYFGPCDDDGYAYGGYGGYGP
jgi:hypothetical protein